MESQPRSLVGVESRGTKRSMREQVGKVDLDHSGQGWVPGKQVLWALRKVYDRWVLRAGIWLNQKGIKKKYREITVADVGYSHFTNIPALNT